jgi:hypothetical protein
LAAASRDVLARGGGTIIIPSGNVVHVRKGPVVVGSVGGTIKPVAVILEPGAQISCEFNDPATDCIQLGDSVLLNCLTPSLTTANILANSDASVATLIAPVDRNGLQESYRLENCSLFGKTPGSNVATAVVDLTSMGDNTYVGHNTIHKYLSSTNAPAFLITPGNMRGGGPMVIEQNWVDTGLSATCFRFDDGNGTNYIGPLYFRANECNNSGNAPSITIKTSAAGHLRNIDVDGFLLSMSTASKIIDVDGCYHCTFLNIQVSSDAESGVTGIYFENSPTMNAGNFVQNLTIACPKEWLKLPKRTS